MNSDIQKRAEELRDRIVILFGVPDRHDSATVETIASALAAAEAAGRERIEELEAALSDEEAAHQETLKLWKDWERYARYCNCCAKSGEHDPIDFKDFTEQIEEQAIRQLAVKGGGP